MTPDELMTWLGLDGPSTTIPVAATEGMVSVPVPKDAMDHLIAFLEYLKYTHPEQYSAAWNSRTS